MRLNETIPTVSIRPELKILRIWYHLVPWLNLGAQIKGSD